jgi:hypothetical protein
MPLMLCGRKRWVVVFIEPHCFANRMRLLCVSRKQGSQPIREKVLLGQTSPVTKNAEAGWLTHRTSRDFLRIF